MSGWVFGPLGPEDPPDLVYIIAKDGVYRQTHTGTGVHSGNVVLKEKTYPCRSSETEFDFKSMQFNSFLLGGPTWNVVAMTVSSAAQSVFESILTEPI